MLYDNPFPSSALALVVLVAFAAPARGEDYSAASSAIDSERINSTSVLGRIRADAAHLRGVTGRGVTIGLLDSGIDVRHREFAEAGKLLPGYNAITGGADVTDRSGHGTHVAGIAGAGRDGKGVFGVAYGALLLPVKIFPDSGSGSTVALDRGLRHVIGKASIASMSVSSSTAYDAQATQDAVRAGMLLVASAGNNGGANPGWPANFAKESWANSQIIAVGAVDGLNRIASFSNRAGDAAAWYLVAPGTGIASAYPNDHYVYKSGTSMAAPMVSGAAALLQQMWPALRADQAATILFVTATDLGAPGIDTVYGRGLLNVEKALQPVGTLTTTTLNGRTINVLSGAVQPSAATSMMWQLASSGRLRVAGLDDFQRDFGVDLGATVVHPASMSIEQAMGNADSRMEVAERVLGDGLSISSVVESRRTDRQGPQRRLSSFSLLARDEEGDELSFGIGGSAPQHFGAAALELGQGLSLTQDASLAHPYFSLVPLPSHAAVARRVGRLKLRVGLLSSGLNQALASQDAYPSAAGLPEANAGLVEVSRSFGNAALSVSMSQTRESNAYLGSWSTSALSLGSHASTSALQVAGAYMIAPKLAIAGQAAYGVTPGARSSDSLVTEISRARTNAFSFALVAADRVRRGDRLSVSVSQPMRTYSGRIVMDVLSRSNGSGTSRERLVFSMVPVGREMRAQLNYQMPAGFGATFGMTLMVRRNPNNLADAAVETLVAARYVKSF